MQKTVSGIKKWLSVRVAEVLDRNDMDVWRLCVSSLRNHKDAGHRVSRSDDPCFNPHEYGFPRACPERSRRVSLLTGVPSDKGPHEQVFVRGGPCRWGDCDLGKHELQSSNRRSKLLQRAHVDHEAVFHVLLQHAFEGLIDLLDRDDLDVGRDLVLAAVLEHLLRFRHPADHRARN